MMNLTLRQLRAVAAVHRTGKIVNAAKELNLSQPAVTLQIRDAEAAVGMPLFDRTSDGMRPTAAGLAVVEAAVAVDLRLRALGEEVEAIRGGRRGALRLGVISTAKYFAPRIIAAFQKLHPDIDVALLVGNRAETVETLVRHGCDIALMGSPPREMPVRATVFGDHPLVIVAAADHELVGVPNIAKRRIAEEKFLIREPGSGTRMSLAIYLSDMPGKAENLGIEMGSNETIKQAVIAGLGIAMISAHTIAQEVELGKLRILDVEGVPIRKQWFSVSRSDRSMSPLMAAFEAFLRTDGKSFLPLVPGA